MFKKMLGIVLVLMTVMAVMLPMCALAEVTNTTTRTLEDGTPLVYTEHLLQPGDSRIGRVSVEYYNGTKYVQEYKLLTYEEWVEDDEIYCKDNVARIVRVYDCRGMLVDQYSF